MEPHLPEGNSGNLRVRHVLFRYPVDNPTFYLEQEAQFLEEWRDGAWMVWMSDTLDEVLLHEQPLAEAHGEVLVGGLGMGFFTYHALRKPEVQHVDVVEISSDVIALVWPHLPQARMSLHHADITDYLRRPVSKLYDYVYLDIWPRIVPENVAEMRRLKRLAQPRLAGDGRVRCWGEDVLAARGFDLSPG